MAQALSISEKTAGLVIGLCPDRTVYERLTSAASARGLTQSTVRAAACARPKEIAVVSARAGSTQVREAHVRELYRVDSTDPTGALLDEVGDDPLLEACFASLADMPGGGAPWQGSWRANALSLVVTTLRRGGVIMVVEAHSLEEQRTWARTLLKSGCTFVHTHGESASAEPLRS